MKTRYLIAKAYLHILAFALIGIGLVSLAGFLLLDRPCLHSMVISQRLESTVPVHILIADDGQDDCLMTLEAFKECRVSTPLHFLYDDEALLDYLHRRRSPITTKSAPLFPA